MSAMNLLSRSNRLVLPPGIVFRPGRVLFPVKMAAPFRPGCSMSASGWRLRRPGWPMSSAGCPMARVWTQVCQPGRSISGAGWPIHRPGRLPISRKEHPGAFMKNPAACMEHPGQQSGRPIRDGERRRLGDGEMGRLDFSKSPLLLVSKSGPPGAAALPVSSSPSLLFSRRSRSPLLLVSLP